MDDLASLFGTKDSGKDLVDKFTVLLEKQTDHKVSPGVLFGLMGLYNLMSIISIAKQDMSQGLKSVHQEAAPPESDQASGSIMDALSTLTSQGSSGTPDLMGMLSGLASKKKINPAMLLSLLSLMNKQTGNSSGSQSAAAGNSLPSVNSTAHISDEDDGIIEQKGEKKNHDSKPANELNRKRG